MNVGGWLLWGFAGTVVLTTIIAGTQALGLTRLNIAYLLGTMFTGNRDRAKLIGVILHLALGWLFALVYAAAFQSWGASWWRGALIGAVHSAFLLMVGMSVLPAIHPRMASETEGPTSKRQLEPPGFVALNYGMGTPIALVLAHVVYGTILGAFYRYA